MNGLPSRPPPTAAGQKNDYPLFYIRIFSADGGVAGRGPAIKPNLSAGFTPGHPAAGANYGQDTAKQRAIPALLPAG
jgi:hypothetical protein